MFKKIISMVVIAIMFIATTLPLGYTSDIEIDTSSSFLYPGYSKKISMDFQNAPLVDVLKIFSQQTKINLISSEELASRLITVYLDNVPVEQALEQVLRANNLTYELQPDSNIYIVKPLTKTDAELLTRVYLLKHANVTKARVANTLKIIYTVDEDTTAQVTEESGDSSGGGGGGEDEGTGMLGAVKAVLTPKGKVVEDTRTNSLTVTDIASNFSNIETAIAKLDIPVPQVLIEVEMLEVSKENGDKIGVKLGETPLTFQGGERDVLYPWNQNQLLRKGAFTFDDPEYRVGTISAAGMTAILQFLSTQSDTKNLARPRILTLSNQPAQIKISTKEAIGLTESTTSSQNLATATSTAERVETGVFLTVTPQVNTVTNEITLAVVPKVITTTPSSITTNGVTLKDPEERGSLSLLRVASGDTIVLGGLLREDHTLVTTKLPILGDIPFIGAPFRHREETVSNRELIIFLTPHILDEGFSEKNAAISKPPMLREQQELIENRLETVERELNNTKRKKL